MLFILTIYGITLVNLDPFCGDKFFLLLALKYSLVLATEHSSSCIFSVTEWFTGRLISHEDKGLRSSVGAVGAPVDRD
jgi:hypothetical protein